jgi:hypothetical protein
MGEMGHGWQAVSRTIVREKSNSKRRATPAPPGPSLVCTVKDKICYPLLSCPACNRNENEELSRHERAARCASRPDVPADLGGIRSGDAHKRVEHFYTSVAAIFEAWVGRWRSGHTQRAYHQDVMAFVRFLGVRWADEAWQL